MYGEGNGTPLQYSCLENPMDGGAGKAGVHGVAEGRFPREENGNSLQCSCLENSMGRGAWRATV